MDKLGCDTHISQIQIPVHRTVMPETLFYFSTAPCALQKRLGHNPCMSDCLLFVQSYTRLYGGRNCFCGRNFLC